MACEPPRPAWWIGLMRPLSASMWILGLSLVLAGILISSGWAGFLPPVGSALVLLGTSNGAVSALSLGSIFSLPNGSRARSDLLTKECARCQSRMESIADILCADAAAVRRTIGLTMERAASEWTQGPSGDFQIYLLCRTIYVAREQDDIFGSGTASDVEHERRLIVVLHRLSGLPVSLIAIMLDRDSSAIRSVLAASAAGGTQ